MGSSRNPDCTPNPIPHIPHPYPCNIFKKKTCYTRLSHSDINHSCDQLAEKMCFSKKTVMTQKVKIVKAWKVGRFPVERFLGLQEDFCSYGLSMRGLGKLLPYTPCKSHKENENRVQIIYICIIK